MKLLSSLILLATSGASAAVEPNTGGYVIVSYVVEMYEKLFRSVSEAVSPSSIPLFVRCFDRPATHVVFALGVAPGEARGLRARRSPRRIRPGEPPRQIAARLLRASPLSHSEPIVHYLCVAHW